MCNVAASGVLVEIMTGYEELGETSRLATSDNLFAMVCWPVSMFYLEAT